MLHADHYGTVFRGLATGYFICAVLMTAAVILHFCKADRIAAVLGAVSYLPMPLILRHAVNIAEQSGWVQNIDPKFYTVNSIKNKSTSTYKVTEAKRNIVYRLNQSTFIDVLRQENMMVSKKIVMGDYILSPFVITLEYPNGDIVEGARTLSYLDHESGAGAFLGDLPEGAILSIGIINRSDVQTSVEAGFDKVVEELKRNEGKYKTILCSTCCARFIALGSNTAAEAEAYLGRLPPGVSLMGIYSYGEYGPVYGSKTHNHYNLFHNFTFSIILL